MSRFCLKQDDDSHWYLIPLDLDLRFDAILAEASNNDDHDLFIDQFDEYRMSGGPFNLSFTNPKEPK